MFVVPSKGFHYLFHAGISIAQKLSSLHSANAKKNRTLRQLSEFLQHLQYSICARRDNRGLRMLYKCVMQQRISTGKHSPKMMEEYEINLPQRKIYMKNLFIISADWFFTAIVDSHQKKHCCDVIHISNDAKTIVID